MEDELRFEEESSDLDDDGESWDAFEEGERLANDEMVDSWNDEGKEEAEGKEESS